MFQQRFPNSQDIESFACNGSMTTSELWSFEEFNDVEEVAEQRAV
jgi:hypothetical protein